MFCWVSSNVVQSNICYTGSALVNKSMLNKLLPSSKTVEHKEVAKRLIMIRCASRIFPGGYWYFGVAESM